MSEEGQEQNVNKKKKKGGLIAVICVSVVIIAVLVGVIIYLLNRNSKSADNEADVDPSRGVVVNEENVQEVLDNLGEPTPPGMYEVVMNSTWNFPSGKEASTDAYVENSTNNSQPVYFDVKLQGTGETVYDSPILPVGTHLDSKDIKLDKELPAGVYDCILTYHLLGEDEKETSSVKLTLTVRIAK